MAETYVNAIYGNQMQDCMYIPGQVIYIVKLLDILYFEVNLFIDKYKKEFEKCYLNLVSKIEWNCFIQLISSSKVSAERYGIFDTFEDITVNVILLYTYAKGCIM